MIISHSLWPTNTWDRTVIRQKYFCSAHKKVKLAKKRMHFWILAGEREKQLSQRSSVAKNKTSLSQSGHEWQARPKCQTPASWLKYCSPDSTDRWRKNQWWASFDPLVSPTLCKLCVCTPSPASGRRLHHTRLTTHGSFFIFFASNSKKKKINLGWCSEA